MSGLRAGGLLFCLAPASITVSPAKACDEPPPPPSLSLLIDTSHPPPLSISDDEPRNTNQLGASGTVNVKGLSPEEAAAKVVGDAGRRPDACVDCCGFESSVATALAAAKSGGKVCLVGMVSSEVHV